MSQYGTANEAHENRQSGNTSSAGRTERSSPKKRVIIATPMNGTAIPTMTW